MLSTDFVFLFSEKTSNEIVSNSQLGSSYASLGTEPDQPDKFRRYADIADLSTECSFVISKNFNQTLSGKITHGLSSMHTVLFILW